MYPKETYPKKFFTIAMLIAVILHPNTVIVAVCDLFSGRCPSGQREQTVNLSASAYGGSKPPLPTTLFVECGLRI